MTNNRKYITNITSKQGAGCICPSLGQWGRCLCFGNISVRGEVKAQKISELRKTGRIMFLPKHSGWQIGCSPESGIRDHAIRLSILLYLIRTRHRA